MHRRMSTIVLFAMLALGLAACAAGDSPAADRARCDRSRRPDSGLCRGDLSGDPVSDNSRGSGYRVRQPGCQCRAGINFDAGQPFRRNRQARGPTRAERAGRAARTGAGRPIEHRPWRPCKRMRRRRLQPREARPRATSAFSAYFPDGEMDAGGWPPVSIARRPGDNRLRRAARTPPDAPFAHRRRAASHCVTCVDLESIAEAAQYRVWVIDAGTTEMMLDQTTTDTSVVVTKSLKPGVYQWVVNGLNARRATSSRRRRYFHRSGANEPATPASAGTASAAASADEAAGLPPTCQPRSRTDRRLRRQGARLLLPVPDRLPKECLRSGPDQRRRRRRWPGRSTTRPIRCAPRCCSKSVLADNQDLKPRL